MFSRRDSISMTEACLTFDVSKYYSIPTTIRNATLTVEINGKHVNIRPYLRRYELTPESNGVFLRIFYDKDSLMRSVEATA